MSKRDWKLFVEDILESIELIESYITDMNFEEFKNESQCQNQWVECKEYNPSP